MLCAYCGAAPEPGTWTCSSHRRPHPRLVVGICGRARHGKNLVAETVRARLLSFGMTVSVVTVSDMVLQHAWVTGLIGSGKPREELTPGELSALVRCGHEERARDENFWVSALTRTILEDPRKIVLVPGVRFPNEAAWLSQVNGLLVRVRRFNLDSTTYIAPDRDPNDPMETSSENLKAHLEVCACTGQERWLTCQASSLADYLRFARDY